MAGVADRVDETWAEGFACTDWAGNDAARAKVATAANRIGAEEGMWLVGRATTAEVTRRNDALLALV